MWFLFREVSSSWVLGMGYIILLWHSLSLPYNYFFMHYSHGFNHFHIHPLYHRHYLQSPVNQIITIYWFLHECIILKTTGIQGLCTLYCIYTQPAPSRLAGQTSCQIIAVHLLSSILVLLGCCYPFLVQNIFSIPMFLIIEPHSMKHKGTLNLQDGS